MKLKKKSEEKQQQETKAKMVSFRFDGKTIENLEIMHKVLDKDKTQILRELIEQGLKAVARDYPGAVKRLGG